MIGLVSHATQDRLKTLVSKLSVIAEHRLDIIKTEGPYEVTEVSTRTSVTCGGEGGGDAPTGEPEIRSHWGF